MGAGRVHRGERRGGGGWPPEVLRRQPFHSPPFTAPVRYRVPRGGRSDVPRGLAEVGVYGVRG